MKDFKNEYQNTPTPAAPTFKSGDRVAYQPNPGQVFYGTVQEPASEPNRYIVRIDAGRLKAIDAHNLTKMPDDLPSPSGLAR